MKILLLIALLCSCSSDLKMNDSDLIKAQNERNREVMLSNGHMIMPPKFDNLPKESESQYQPPADNRTIWDKILKVFNI